MGFLSKIKDAIFGRQANADSSPITQPTAHDQKVTTPSKQAAKSISQIDVETILDELLAKSGQKLNWRTSIVDLMKLLDLDSSLVERKNLARELGYVGTMDGSAEMNMWLHREVMRELAANGGKVPPELLK